MQLFGISKQLLLMKNRDRKEVIRMIITIDEIKKLKDIPNTGYDNIKVEFLFHSNKLEGSTFTKGNLEKYLKENIIEGSHKVDDVYETINSMELFDFCMDTLSEPLTERLILEFHQLLKKNTMDQARGFVGVWKKIPNVILGVGGKLELAQPYEVPKRMESLLANWNNGKKDFEAIMKFHSEFEHIHPVQDGNGRLGRFIIFKQCVENEVDLISMDETYSDDYKQGLFLAQTKNDFTDLIKVFKSCQQLLDDKLNFLAETLKCLKTLD